jgi:serine/threonine protein kinase
VKRMKCRTLHFVYAKVDGFGLSNTKETSSTFSNQTLNTGTPRWMAPEVMGTHTSQSEGSISSPDKMKKYPSKCDVYSFGMKF